MQAVVNPMAGAMCMRVDVLPGIAFCPFARWRADLGAPVILPARALEPQHLGSRGRRAPDGYFSGTGIELITHGNWIDPAA